MKKIRHIFLCLALALPLGAALADPLTASRYYEDGLARFQKQDIPGAVIQLKNALQLDRNMLAAHLLLARAYLLNSELGLAELEFKEALRQGVSRAEVSVPLSRIYLLQGRPALLIELITPDGLPAGVRLDVLTLRGVAYAALGKMADAERSFAEARAIDPNSALPLTAEVPALLGAGRMDLARSRALKAVQLAPGDANALNALASVAHASGDLASALKDYERAIALSPGFVDARIARAGLLVDLGRDSEARTDLEEIAKKGPVEPRVAYLQALLASRRGDAQQATKHLKEAALLVDALPAEWIAGHEQLLMVGALAHHAGHQYEKARKYLDVLIGRYPHNFGAHKLLAAIYVETGDHARATRMLEKILLAQPEDPQALYLLGRVKLAEKHYAKATELLEKAAQGGDTKAQASLGFSLLGKGDPTAASKNMLAAFNKMPGDVGLAITLSNTLMRQGDKRKALDVAQRTATAQPGNPAALNLLGAIKGASGDLPGARTAYLEALKRDAGFTPAHLNLARLDAAEGRFDDARKTYAKLLIKDKHNAVVMYESALIEQRAGKAADAMRWFEKAAAESPNDVRIGLALIQAKAAAGDKPGALETAKSLSTRRKDNIAVSAALAQSQIDAGDNKSALQTLRNMQRIAGFDADALVRIGHLEIAAGYPADAAYVAQKALQGKPGDLKALVLAAEAALLVGDGDKAGEFGKEIRQQHPRSAEGYRVAGELALFRNQFAAAGESFRQAFDRQPSTTLLRRRVSVHVAQGNPVAAVAMVQDWLKSHDKDTAARKALAELRMRAGDWHAARKEYETIVGYGEHDAEVFNNLANVLLELKDAKALEFARQAQVLDPRSPNTLDTLGWSLVAAGKIDEAMLVLRDARLRAPDNLDIRFHLASVLASQGRNEEARAELRGMLAQVKRDSLSAERVKLIRELGL